MQLVEEVKAREIERQRNLITTIHEAEQKNIEIAQKRQIQTFAANWDAFMDEYEKSAVSNIEKIKVKKIKFSSDFIF